MARRCELTGKGVMSGHHVSHANNKTKRVFRPNLQTVSLSSELLGQKVRLRISMNALRTVDHSGGLDAYLLRAKDTLLSERALRFKRLILKNSPPPERPAGRSTNTRHGRGLSRPSINTV